MTDQPEPTTVVAPMRRPSFSSDMFADLVGADVSLSSWEIGRPCWSLVFSGVGPGPALSDAEVAAVRARMESVDDADQGARAQLRADRDALASEDPLRRLYDYMLGD